MALQYLLWLQSFREATGGALNSFFLILSASLNIYAVAIPCFIYWCVSKKRGAFVILNLITVSMGMETLKATVCELRPWIRFPQIHPVVTASGYSFPSGHASIAAAIFGTTASLWRKKLFIVIPCIAMILLVGFSRNYLGVHTPQDVLCGFALGAAAICVNAWVLRWSADNSRRETATALLYVLASFAMIFYAANKTYPPVFINGKPAVDPARFLNAACFVCGGVNGFFAGLFLEKRLVNFSTDGGVLKKTLRFTAGFALFFLLASVTKTPLASADPNLWKALCGAMTAIYVIALYPYLFSRIERLCEKHI